VLNLTDNGVYIFDSETDFLKVIDELSKEFKQSTANKTNVIYISKKLETINELKKEKAEKVSAELEQDDYKKEIRALLGDRSELGLFSFKERKEIDEKMEVLRTKISGLELLVEKQKKEKEKDIAARNSAIRQEMRPMEERKRIIITRISEIEAEFVMNR